MLLGPRTLLVLGRGRLGRVTRVYSWNTYSACLFIVASLIPCMLVFSSMSCDQNYSISCNFERGGAKKPITRIKNIKNVTRCRDSRSAKSIETR